MKTRIPVLLMAREIGAGGSERQLVETALGLDQTRFEPYVGAFRPKGPRVGQLEAAGIPVVPIPVYSFRSRAAITEAWRMARFIRNQGIKLVHTFDAPSTVYAVPVVRYLTRAVMLSSQRGHRSLTPEMWKLLRWTDGRVDGIVVNCQFLKRHMTEEERVPERLVRVCYNGIDLEQFRRDATGPRPAALPADGSFVIGVVCMLRPEKGLETLLEAFRRVRTLRPDMKLAIVGSGPQLEMLQAVAREKGIAEDCIWQPATEDVAQWMRSFDIFVLPSLSEALSNAIMEAMACGCPVVASNVGGNPELVAPGVRGLLFENRDAEGLAKSLARLIGDQELRQRLGAAGERFIHEGFSRQSAARNMGAIYESFVKSI